MVIGNMVGDLNWLWVFIGVGAFLTVIATFVYAMTSESRPARPRRRTPAARLDGSHERLPGDDLAAREDTLV